MYVSQLPGYIQARNRADRIEDYWRDFAFLGIDETLRIAGGHKLEVRPLTLRMFIQLCAVRSPFLVGGKVKPEHVLQILWRISTDYGPTNTEARKIFVIAISSLPFLASIRSIDRYLDRQLRDRPPSPAVKTDNKMDTSYAAMVIHLLASQYGWGADAILDLPMSCVFQYIRRIDRSKDPEMGYWNPIRDRLTRRITSKFMKRKNANKES